MKKDDAKQMIDKIQSEMDFIIARKSDLPLDTNYIKIREGWTLIERMNFAPAIQFLEIRSLLKFAVNLALSSFPSEESSFAMPDT